METIVRVLEGNSLLWTGTLEDLLENCGDLPQEKVDQLTEMQPGTRVQVNHFMVERIPEVKVPRLVEEEDEESPLDRAEQQLMHALTVMGTARAEIKDALRDLGPSDVVRLRRRVEDTANELLAVGCELADIETELE